MAIYVDWSKAPEGTTHAFTGHSGLWRDGIPDRRSLWEKHNSDGSFEWKGAWVSIGTGVNGCNLTKRPDLPTPRPHAELIKRWAGDKSLSLYLKDSNGLLFYQQYPSWEEGKEYVLMSYEEHKKYRLGRKLKQLYKEASELEQKLSEMS